jgi:hypothetical protein
MAGEGAGPVRDLPHGLRLLGRLIKARRPAVSLRGAPHRGHPRVLATGPSGEVI